MKKLLMLFFAITMVYNQTEGCTDPVACNFDPQSVIDDGSCIYPDECGICYGINNSCISETVNFLSNWNGTHDVSILANYLLDNWNQYVLKPYNDIWGYTDEAGTEYALIGTWDGTHIIDISTNLNQPVEIGFISGSFSTHRDIKTYNNYIYIGTEANLGNPLLLPDWVVDPEGVQVVDISDPTNPVLVNEWTGITQSHNLMTDDNGYLYVIGTNDLDDLNILDLSDPVNPEKVGGWSYYESPSSDGYLHDVCIHGDILYGCGIYVDRIYAIDISDKTNPYLIDSWDGVPFSHACWVSGDGRTLFTASETTGGHIMSWDVFDLSNVQLLDEWLPEGGNDWSAHNIFVKEDFLYISYYVYGLQILDISNPENMTSIGYYDTLEESPGISIYSGIWGVYPYLNDNKILISDRINGVYVLDNAPSTNLGDVNIDGDVNVLDIILVVNFILTNEYNGLSDLNSDGNVDVVDVVQLVNIIIEG